MISNAALTEGLSLVLVWLAGNALGAMFFGGLWWTVRRCISSKQPALLFLASMLLRMSLALTGFYLVAGSNWQRLLLCLLGFVMARLLVTWLTRLMRRSSLNPIALAREDRHAS